MAKLTKDMTKKVKKKRLVDEIIEQFMNSIAKGEKSLLAGQKIAEIASQVTEKDLVFVCVTGGCSSLMVLPPEPLSIQDISALGKELMKCGAAISDINTVRKHTCRLKGGGLLNMLKKARVITLTQDTRPENLPWPDPVLPDPTTFQDALDVLKKYNMYENVPQAVVEYIKDGLKHPERESLKTEEGISHQLYDVGNQRSACEAAKNKAEELGYHGYILSTKIEGEAREVGSAFAGIAKEVSLYNRPFIRPCVIIMTMLFVCQLTPKERMDQHLSQVGLLIPVPVKKQKNSMWIFSESFVCIILLMFWKKPVTMFLQDRQGQMLLILEH